MRIALKIMVVDPTCWSKSALVMVDSFSGSASIWAASAFSSAPSAGYTMIWEASLLGRVRRAQGRLENSDDLECDTAEVQPVSDPRIKLACDVRAQDRDARSFVSCDQEATLGHVDARLVELFVGARDVGGDDLGHAEPREFHLLEGDLDLRIHRSDTGHRADLVRDGEVDRHDADPDAPARGITDDDLADVVVTAA
jgi:hypothetical protein